jgi:hypothetical protein
LGAVTATTATFAFFSSFSMSFFFMGMGRGLQMMTYLARRIIGP